VKIGDIEPNLRLRHEKDRELELYKNLNEKVLLVFYQTDDSPAFST
jgi:peroxiredoxin